MPTGMPAGRRARRRAPALGDARDNNSSNSKGQWGHSHLQGLPRDILQPPGPCRENDGSFIELEPGVNMYTHSAHIHGHADTHTDPKSKYSINIHANVCAHVCMHTREATGKDFCPSDITV